MDQILIDLFLSAAPPADKKDSEAALRIVDEETGEIEIDSPDGAKKYFLKPLTDLFCSGSGASSIDWKDKRFIPLLFCVEEEIINIDNASTGMTDGLVGLTLDRMAINPATAAGNDPICRRIQLALRIQLSMNNYSKQEVKLAIRKIAKSVELHSSHAGIRGYLDFIHKQFKR